MNNIIEVNDDNFDHEVVRASQPVLVDFHATWCGPCKAIAPMIEALAGEYAGRVRFVKVDVDQAPTTAAQHRITGVPTLMVYQGGQVRDTVVGGLSALALKARIDAVLAAPASA